MLIVLVVLAVAAVLFVAAVVATQEGEVLADAPPDRPDVDLPAGRVVAEDLRSVRFGMVLRGYRMSEVDDVLDRLGGELAERDERIADLERALAEVVEPAVREAEDRQAAQPPPAAEEGPAPAAAEVAALPDVEALTATDDAFAPEPGAGTAEEELTPLPEEWVATASATAAAPAAAAAPEPSSAAQASADPLDPGWEPSTVERALDLAASYRVSMPVGSPPRVPADKGAPEGEGLEDEPSVGEAPAGEAPAGEAEDEGFPEVEPAEPAPGWAPQERDLDGDEGRERRPTSEP